MQTRRAFAANSALLLGWCLTGCNRQNSAQIDYDMGEKITLGPLRYNIIESAWRNQLGEAFKLRVPQHRFLLITISITNGGGTELSVPFFQLENSSGQAFPEEQSGEGVDNWFGLLRTISPAQTQQGRILFDVPLSSYKLRITDGAGPGAEKYAWVSIPLRMDVDAAPTPVPGDPQ